MIPVFGILSVLVLLGSVAALIFHSRLLLLRGTLDNCLNKLDEHLRLRLEIIYEIAEIMEDEQGIIEQCIENSGKDTRQIIRNLPKLHKAIEDLKNNEDKALEENAQEIEQSTKAYNDVLVKYNEYVSKFPGIVLAFLVGLKTEKPIVINLTAHPPTNPAG